MPAARAAAVVIRTLANGLQVVVVEDRAAAVVQTAMWYRFGSLAETPGKTGLAHGLEHMMFRGTRAVSGGGLDDIAARLGAVVNAATAEDYTHFYTILPADKVDLAIRLEADRMRGLTLSQTDWKLEKGAVLAEYDGDWSQPLFELSERVRARIYAGSPYAHDPLGARADVVASKAADLRRYYDRWYRPNNATLVVTGDVTPDTVFASAQRWFGPIRATALPSPPMPNPRATPSPSAPAPSSVSPAATPPITPAPAMAPPAAAIAIAREYPYAVVDVAYRIPGDLDPDAAATQVFATMIDNERSSFYRALVLPKLVLGYSASADTALHEGVMHVQLFVTPGVRPQTAQRAFETAMAAVRKHGVDPGLLQAAKIGFARQAIYARDAIDGLGDRYGYAYGVERHDPSVDDAQVAMLDVPALDAAVATYFAAPQAIGVLTPRLAKRGTTSAGAAERGVSDDFSNRAPTGRIVLARWVRASLAEPSHVASRVAPASYRLANGLRLLVQPVHANPTVFVSGSIALSPAFDPPQQTGLGGLASSLVSYGSAHYDFDAQRKLADTLGADVQLGAGFGAHGLARDLDRLLDLTADGVRRPLFPARYVALVKAQELASLSQRDASPDYRADRAFSELLYAPGDPALRQESQRSVRAIDVRALHRYALRYFRPDRTQIVIAGDVDPRAARDAVERAFGGWANDGPQPHPLVPALRPTRDVTRVIPALRTTVSVRMGQRAIARTNPDFYAYNLLDDVLGAGGGFDTRLMHEIRERRGLVYAISSLLSASRERGVFEIDFNAAPKDATTAAALARAQVLRLTREPVGAGELARAKQKLVAGTLVGEQSTSTIVARLENIASNRLPPDYYATMAQRYTRITAAQLLTVARRYLRSAFATVYEGPLPQRTQRR